MQQKKFIRYFAGGATLLIIIVWVIASYNSLVNADEKVKQLWSDVQSTYQRRLNLIPNLVNVVKGVSGYEQETLVKIAEARTESLNTLSNTQITGENYQKQNVTQDSVAAAANRVILIIERYPVLKGTAAYSGLQTQIEGTERRIVVARTDFNKAVARYNRKVRGFPNSLIAGIFGFKKKEGFTADAGTDKSVEIKFK
jgi:LemA protein